jgi:hypothetical protein
MLATDRVKGPKVGTNCVYQILPKAGALAGLRHTPIEEFPDQAKYQRFRVGARGNSLQSVTSLFQKTHQSCALASQYTQIPPTLQ